MLDFQKGNLVKLIKLFRDKLYIYNISLYSSVGRAPVSYAGGREFDPR